MRWCIIASTLSNDCLQFPRRHLNEELPVSLLRFRFLSFLDELALSRVAVRRIFFWATSASESSSINEIYGDPAAPSVLVALSCCCWGWLVPGMAPSSMQCDDNANGRRPRPRCAIRWVAVLSETAELAFRLFLWKFKQKWNKKSLLELQLHTHYVSSVHSPLWIARTEIKVSMFRCCFSCDADWWRHSCFIRIFPLFHIFRSLHIRFVGVALLLLRTHSRHRVGDF